jgi:acetate---CoA ligase (ADP-forming)
VAAQCAGAGVLVVFAGGFGERGRAGGELEQELLATARTVGVRVLGPNSAGIIRPGVGLAASFLTCLDRPVDEIRGGAVAVVTQSGGLGSYLHNLAAAGGGGIAVSVSTGNEADIEAGEVVEAVAGLDEVAAIVLVLEAVRDGDRFVAAVKAAEAAGTPLVVCRLGTEPAGKSMMVSHTGAMAVPEAVLDGVLDSLGVVVTDTPAEAYEIACVLAAVPAADGNRLGVATHSGGTAIMLADLGARLGLSLPQPGAQLQRALEPFLDHGSPRNPLDMGGIIGGPGRFAAVVDTMCASGEYDAVLAVSTPHPPAHTAARADALLALDPPIPLLHLWMAGDQAASGLAALRNAGRPVTTDPAAAMKALAGLVQAMAPVEESAAAPIGGPLESWGLPLVAGESAADRTEAAERASALGFPVVLKLIDDELAHRTEAGAVILDLRSDAEVGVAFERLRRIATELGLDDAVVRVEPYRPGLELIVGGVVDPVFGPMVSVGFGGVLAELLGDVVFARAPVSEAGASAMIDRLHGRALLDGYREHPPADVAALARIVGIVGRGITGSGLVEVEINPLVWTGGEWLALDWLVIDRSRR